MMILSIISIAALISLIAALISLIVLSSAAYVIPILCSLPLIIYIFIRNLR